MFRLFPKLENKILRLQHNVLVSFCLAQILISLIFFEQYIVGNLPLKIVLFISFPSLFLPLIVILFARYKFTLISPIYISIIYLVTIVSSIQFEATSPKYFIFIVVTCINLAILTSVCINWKIGLASLPLILLLIFLDSNFKSGGFSNHIIENNISELTFSFVVIFLVSTTIIMVITFASTFTSIIKDYKSEAKKRENIEKELLEKNTSLNSLNSELEENMSMLEETYDRMEYAFQKAKESDDLKTAFLENISHEVRTPLNAIQGFLGLIKERNDENDCGQNELIEPTIDAGNQLVTTITDIVELAHIDANLMSIENERVDLKEYFFDKHAEFSRGCEAKGILFLMNFSVQDHLLEVYIDRWKLDQILNHLLSNAVKFTFEGKIQLDCTIEDNQLVFSITDTGIGIKKESLETIFDKFRKGNMEDDSTLYRGLGIGLTIVKELVKCLSGDLKVESEENKGSVFTIKLPVDIVHKENKAPQVKTTKKAGSILKVLIAEDDVSNFYYLNAILKKEKNIQAVHVWNGQEAIDIFKTTDNFDLVLMDIKMPVKDGVEAFHEIKAINPLTPIFAITAYALSHDKRKYDQLGFDGFISKPVRKEDLLKVIYEFQ